MSILLNSCTYYLNSRGLTKSVLVISGYGGMSPTLESGDVVVVEKPSKLERGTLICFKLREQQLSITKKDTILNHKGPIVGRIIGLSGEEIELKNYNVYINGKLIAEDYATNPKNEYHLKVNIPINHYFILQDNRIADSKDSRKFGTISKENILYEIQEIYKSKNLNPKTILTIIGGFF